MRITAHDLEFSAIRAEFELPPAGSAEFSGEAIAEARAAHDAHAGERVDRTDIELVTIDPPGSMDLDQAVCLETRDGGGWRVFYAIADVGALVLPGGAVEAASLQRGQTMYLPDGSVPLHPRELSEDLASLLPEQTRAAVLWTVDLDAAAAVTAISVERARVKSRRRLDYAQVQAWAEAGTLPPSIVELPAVGRALRAAGIASGAINLRIPEQDIERDASGAWELRIEPRTEADEWNAQISLLVGRCAARLMLDGGVGLLRTLPPAGADTIRRLRAAAAALHLQWPEGQSLGVFLDGVDVNTPKGLAMMRWATSALRGADYVAFRGSEPDLTVHAGIGAPYAHVTAPLRRLGDRFATEICLALVAGRAVPDWVSARLDALPEVLASSGRKDSSINRACVDLAEAVVLEPLVGREFDVYVLRGAPAPTSPNGIPARGGARETAGAHKPDGDVTQKSGEVFLARPPVFGPCTGPVSEGEKTRVRLVSADRATRTVAFAAASAASADLP